MIKQKRAEDQKLKINLEWPNKGDREPPIEASCLHQVVHTQ